MTKQEQLKARYQQDIGRKWSLPSMQQIEEYVEYENGNVSWETICTLNLPEYFVNKWFNYMDWSMISRYSTILSDKFLIRHKNKINWKDRCQFLPNGISPTLMRTIPEQLSWITLSSVRMWTVDELREFRNYIDWTMYKHNTLAITSNVDFFREFSKELEWEEWKNKG